MAMEKAATTMSNYINAKQTNGNDSWLVTQIKAILTKDESYPKPHLFLFTNDRSSAKFNTKIIKMQKYNFIKACEMQTCSILNPGTEFRSINNLHHLFAHHEDWEELNKQKNQIDEVTRRQDLQATISRGNHKFTSKQAAGKILRKTFTKEVEKGWVVPVTLNPSQK